MLFRGCKIKKGAVVKNCVLMQDTVVEPNCNVEYVVTDKNVHITEDKKLTGTDTFPVFVAKGHSVKNPPASKTLTQGRHNAHRGRTPSPRRRL